ncbi:MAG: hypothetical protein ACOY5R_10980 [Pseudomonadota bacterium]
MGTRYKVYDIPKGFVSADPGRNRYIRRQGSSLELPPRLHPAYDRDRFDPSNAINKEGVVTDLGVIALGAPLAGVPSSAIEGIGGAALVGLGGWKELRELERKK